MARKKTAKRTAKVRKAAKARRPTRVSAKGAAPKRPAAAAPAHNPWKAYAANLAREAATTLKVLRAFPAGQDNFQPHPRSSRAAQLATTFVVEQMLALKAIDGSLKVGGGFPPPFPTVAAAAAEFERAVAQTVAAASAAPISAYTRQVEFFTAPKTVGKVPAGPLAEMMLADQIHHRGQLSVYVRMAGGKVPSIYGPSADEPW